MKKIPAKKTPLSKRIAKVATKTKKLAKKVNPPKPLAPRGKKSIGSTLRANKTVTLEMDVPTKVDEDAPRIECRLLVGDLSLPIDAASLERTLGAGRWGHGFGMVDSWSDAAWVGLLAHLKLPADPLDRTVAEQPVKRLVQRLWYEAINPAVLVDRKDVFVERDNERAEEYKEKFGRVEGIAKGRSERAVKSFAKGRGGETKYVPTDKLKAKGLTIGGQAGILLEAFKAAKFASMSTHEATEGMIKAGLKTTTKPERISAFYLCQWVKKGLLERTVV